MRLREFQAVSEQEADELSKARHNAAEMQALLKESTVRVSELEEEHKRTVRQVFCRVSSVAASYELFVKSNNCMSSA